MREGQTLAGNHWIAAGVDTPVADSGCNELECKLQCMHWQEVIGLLQEVVLQLLTPDVTSWHATTNACEKGKHWQEAIGLLQETIFNLLMLGVMSWNAAISACEKGQQW